MIGTQITEYNNKNWCNVPIILMVYFSKIPLRFLTAGGEL